MTRLIPPRLRDKTIVVKFVSSKPDWLMMIFWCIGTVNRLIMEVADNETTEP
jgi:hypothetical protein